MARDAKKLEEVAAKAKEISPSLETLVISADISDDAVVKGLYQKVDASFGHADILINNAGLLKADGNIDKLDPALWLSDFVRILALPSLHAYSPRTSDFLLERYSQPTHRQPFS